MFWPHDPAKISLYGLGSTDFARHYFRYLYLISFPAGTEMFQFSAFASMKLCIHFMILLTEGVAPFGNLRIKACLAAPRSLSQLATSFFAS